MTADGSENKNITPKSLKDLKIPPSLNIPSVGADPE